MANFGMIWCDKASQNRHVSACIKCSGAARNRCASYQEWKTTMLFCPKRAGERIHENACITCGAQSKCSEYLNHHNKGDEDMAKAKDRTMASMVAEYNELTGEKVKKFKNKAEAKKALAKANKPANTAKAAGSVKKAGAIKVMVGKDGYRSAADAFRAIGVEGAKCVKFRKELNKEGTKVWENADGTKHTFKIV